MKGKKSVIALLLAATLCISSVCPALATEAAGDEADTMAVAEEVDSEAVTEEEGAGEDTASDDLQNIDEEQAESDSGDDLSFDDSEEDFDTSNDGGTEVSAEIEEAEADENPEPLSEEEETEEVSAQAVTSEETAAAEEALVAEEGTESSEAVFAGGKGTEADPYKVSTAAQLDAVRNYPNKYFIQTADIDISGRNWVPIKAEYDSETFYYNGNNKTVSGLSITDYVTPDGTFIQCIGLFGIANIQNLYVNSANINIVVTDTGALVNSIGIVAGFGTISNCSAKGTINVTAKSGAKSGDIGGLVGTGARVSNCHSDVNIVCTNNSDEQYNVGGICGDNDDLAVSLSYNKGDITVKGTGSVIAGGIGGYVRAGKSRISAENCVNYGDITSENGNASLGGIVGIISRNVDVSDCVNFGDVKGDSSNNASGIASCWSADSSFTVMENYNLGDISGNANSARIMGLEGSDYSDILDNNYAFADGFVNGNIPTDRIGFYSPNGMSMGAESLKNSVAEILNACGCEWVNPEGEDTEIDHNTIIYYKDGRNSVKLDYGLDDCITGSSTSYDPKLAYLLIALATSAYQGEQPFTLLDKRGGGFRSGGFPDDPLAITESLRNLGFSAENIIEENYYTDAYDPDYNEDSTAFTLATKVLSNGERVVTIVVRGSYGGFGQDGKFHVNWTKWASDWRGNTNFKNYNKGLHEGFSEAADEIINRLDKFLTEKAIGKDDTKYVITGHSRGAAVANLVSKKLIDSGVSKNKVYDYNFACPDSGRDYDREWNRNNKYGSMFNINNVKDIVGVIPGNVFNASLNLNTAITEVFSLDHEFGILFWGKYGTTYFFSKNWETVGDNAIGDPNVEHQPTYYLNYLKKPSESQFKSWTEARAVLAANGVKEGFKKFGRLIGIFCPVDTEIIDSSGHKVAEIINGEQKYYNNSLGQVTIITAADQCLIYLSGNDDYSVNMKGVDDGTLDFFASYAIATNEDHTTAFENIVLEQGMEINCAINSDEEIEKTGLYVVDENGTPIEKILHDGNEGPVIHSGTEAWDGDEYGVNQRELIWKFEENGTLRLRYEGLSTGETYSLQKADNYSWREFNNSVLEIHVGENISNIGKESLDGYPKLRRIFFEYDPPTFMTDNSVSSPLIGKSLEIHYPADNAAWNGLTGSNYGGNITWEPCYSGVCGNGLNWVLDSKGTLVISGSGVMYNWTDETKTPWNKHVTDIKAIVIKNGVRSIGSAAFKNCTNVSDVSIGNTVTDIGKYAFYECGLLKTIKIPSKVTNIGDAAFAFCADLETVTIPSSVITIGNDVFTNCSSNLVISGKAGSYAEQYTKEQGLSFIDPSNIDYATVSGLTTKIYNGRLQTQNPIVKIGTMTLKSGRDYTVSYENNINVGTAKVVITGIGAYTGAIKKGFLIKPKKIKPAVSLSKIAFTYTGKVQKPNVAVRDGDNRLRTSDYDIIWPADCKNAGTYKVSIKLKGNYSGSTVVSYTIKKAPNKVTAKNIVKTYSAKAQSFTLGAKITNGTPKYASSSKSVTVNKAGKVTVKGKFIGKATITILAPEYKNYSKITKKIIITVNPTKTALSSVTSPSAGKMTVRWKKNVVGTGYQVQYSTSSKFTSPKAVFVTKNTTLTKTIGSLTKGKKYCVRIRTYKTVGSTKFYSAWSATKIVTIKK